MTTDKDFPASQMDDLTRLREIAEEGRRAPLLGGGHLILWGGLVGLAALLNWAMVAGAVSWPAYSLAIIWFGVLLVGWIISFMLSGRLARDTGPMTTGNRVERTVWITLGAFMATLAVGIFVYMQLGGAAEAAERARFFMMMAPVGFGAYAIALNASAVAGDEPRLKPFVVLSLAFAAVSVLLLGRVEQYLVMALGLALVSIAPGVMLVNATKTRG